MKRKEDFTKRKMGGKGIRCTPALSCPIRGKDVRRIERGLIE
jgi:hypothetical protein